MRYQRILAHAQLANSIGDGVYLVTSAFYFARIVGLSATEIGLGLTLGWAVGSVAGVPLGHLADRRGPRGVAVVLALATAVAVASFLFVRSFALFTLVACLYGTAQTGLSAARQALLAALVEPAERTSVRAMLQATLNGGLAAGAALGGLALHAGTREGYLAVLALDAAGFLLAAALLLRLPPVPPSVPSSMPPFAPTSSGPRLAVLRDRPYALITLINAVMLFYMPLLSVVVPLWVADRTSAPTWVVSVLLLINTGGVVLFQVRVARGVRGLGDAAAAVRRAGFVMFAACAVFALSPYGWVFLLVAAVLQVIAELSLASGAWEIGFTLAPDDQQGQYQAFFGTGTAVARMLGPVVLTTLVLGGGTAGWLLTGTMFAAAGLTMGPAVRWAARPDRAQPGARRRPFHVKRHP
ncbi:MFS transporter [Nonomuraea antimicrobica]|uniref:MFS transporter n=1 Tax=Nonomuraea antimicrobica TaxID=561173 RepID=A0ABP7BW52_9ACTN